MKKNISFIALSLLLWAIPLLPVGGGVFLYRYNKALNDVEFFFAFDPQQPHQNRKGFEYPGGNIGPEHKNNYDGNDIDGFALTDLKGLPKKKDDKTRTFDFSNPYTFLNGAIRELLEELVFIPAVLLQEKGIFKPSQPNRYEHPYSHNKANHTYETEAVSFIAEHIKKTGLFFIYKPNVTNQTPPKLDDKTAVFFWDITNICPANLPKKIVDSREDLKTKGLNLGRVDAEPVAFAWVTGNEIKRALDPIELKKANGEAWVTCSEYAQDSQANTLDVFKNGKILLSKVCMGMMRDRDGDQYNPQPNIFVATQEDANTDYLIEVSKQGTRQIPFDPDFQKQQMLSSSMITIIDVLQQNPDLFAALKSQKKSPKVSNVQAKEFVTQALELATLLK